MNFYQLDDDINLARFKLKTAELGQEIDALVISTTETLVEFSTKKSLMLNFKKIPKTAHEMLAETTRFGYIREHDGRSESEEEEV